MSKRSRTFQPSASQPTPNVQPVVSDSADGTATAAVPSAPAAPKPTSGTATSGSRAEARRRSTAPKPTAQPSFFDRYKLLIIGGAGVVVVLLALVFFTRSSATAYECVSFLTPSPSSAPASPAPGETPLLGMQTADMGRNHVVQGASVRYDYCPPASGNHYNLGGGQAPLARRLYGPADGILPQQWIHNLEHGDVVLLYRGDPGQQVLDQLQGIMDDAAVSAWSQANCGPVNKVIAVRFDDMDPNVHFAAVAWDRALLLTDFDREQLLGFANQWQDGPQTPERICS